MMPKSWMVVNKLICLCIIEIYLVRLLIRPQILLHFTLSYTLVLLCEYFKQDRTLHYHQILFNNI
jgi:hypothetical protein